MLAKKAVFENFAIFTRKYVLESLVNKGIGLGLQLY